jgi:hypothetical protein
VSCSGQASRSVRNPVIGSIASRFMRKTNALKLALIANALTMMVSYKVSRACIAYCQMLKTETCGVFRTLKSPLILVQYSPFPRLTSRSTQIGIKAMVLTCFLENKMRTWNRNAEGNALFEVLYFVFLSSDKKLNRIRSSLL